MKKRFYIEAASRNLTIPDYIYFDDADADADGLPDQNLVLAAIARKNGCNDWRMGSSEFNCCGQAVTNIAFGTKQGRRGMHVTGELFLTWGKEEK